MENNEHQEPLKVLEKYHLPEIYDRTWEMLRLRGKDIQGRGSYEPAAVGFSHAIVENETSDSPVTFRAIGYADENNQLMITYEEGNFVTNIIMDRETILEVTPKRKEDGVLVLDFDFADKNPEDILTKIVPLLDRVDEDIVRKHIEEAQRSSEAARPERFSAGRILSSIGTRLSEK